MKSIVKAALSHVCFATSDLASTRAFYEGLLHLKVVHEFKNQSGDLYGLFFQICPGNFLEFFLGEGKYEEKSIFRHVCFAVDNLKDFATYLAQHGHRCHLQRGRTDRTLQTWIQDPNGIKIELHQYDNLSKLKKFQGGI